MECDPHFHSTIFIRLIFIFIRLVASNPVCIDTLNATG